VKITDCRTEVRIRNLQNTTADVWCDGTANHTSVSTHEPDKCCASPDNTVIRHIITRSASETSGGVSSESVRTVLSGMNYDHVVF